VPFDSVVVVMLGGGVITTFEDAAFVVFATEVASIDTVILEETDAGAL
jgi:hypothetical protein